MIQAEERVERRAVAGTEVLSWRISLPQGEDGTRMGELYREVGARVEAFCESRLRPWAEAEYERCEDPKKRFHFRPYFYRLETRFCENEDSLTVSMTAVLGRKGSADLLDWWEGELIWSVREDCLLMPMRGGKKEKKKSSDRKNGQ